MKHLNYNNKIVNGNCIDELKKIPEKSFDSRKNVLIPKQIFDRKSFQIALIFKFLKKNDSRKIVLIPKQFVFKLAAK